MRKLLFLLLATTILMPVGATDPIPPLENRWIEAEKSISNESLMFLSLPGRRWGFGISLPYFKIDKTEVGTSGYTKELYASAKAQNAEKHAVASAFIEIDPRYHDLNKLMTDQWPEDRKKEMEATDFKTRIEGTAGLVEYYIPTRKGLEVKQRVLHAYWLYDGCWIEFHISKFNYQPGQEKLLYLLVDTAVIFQGSDRQSLKEFIHANTLYYQKDYKKAAAVYESLIWGERLEPTLDADGLRMATDNLGMAYALLGDLKKSQATYEKAIKQDPEYSGYHYNFACTLAEMDKLDEAIAELRLAYQFIANQIEGEKLPNPRTDDSFKRYMKNDKFLKALAEMEKGK